MANCRRAMRMPWHTGLLVAALGAAAEAGAAPQQSDVQAFGAGVDLHADEGLEDIGLPLYPGAVRSPERKSEPSGYRFGLKLGSFGWSIHVTTWRTPERIEDVAAYYLHALAAYGSVLDCARPGHVRAAAASAPASRASGAAAIACDESESARHGHIVYKVGTHDAYRIASLRRVTGGTEFELVRVQERGH